MRSITGVSGYRHSMPQMLEEKKHEDDETEVRMEGPVIITLPESSHGWWSPVTASAFSAFRFTQGPSFELGKPLPNPPAAQELTAYKFPSDAELSAFNESSGLANQRPAPVSPTYVSAPVFVASTTAAPVPKPRSRTSRNNPFLPSRQ